MIKSTIYGSLVIGQIFLLVLKLFYDKDWPWVWVLSPSLISGFIVGFAFFIVACVVVGIRVSEEENKKKENE